MCRSLILFVLLFGLSALSWSLDLQSPSDSTPTFAQQLDSDLASLSPEQLTGALLMLQLFREEFPTLDLRLGKADNALQQTQVPLTQLSPDILAVQAASERELFKWKVATVSTAAVSVGTLAWLIYLGVTGHIHR